MLIFLFSKYVLNCFVFVFLCMCVSYVCNFYFILYTYEYKGLPYLRIANDFSEHYVCVSMPQVGRLILSYIHVRKIKRKAGL